MVQKSSFRFLALTMPLVFVFHGMAYGQGVDSLVAAYNKSAAPQAHAEIAYAIVAALGDGQYALAHRYALQGYVAQRALPPSAIRIKLANTLGSDYSDREGNYDSALYYYGIALDAARVLKETGFEHSVLGNIGATYSAKGDYPQALKYQLAVLNYWEAQKDERHVVLTTSAIGDTYFFMDKYGEALQFYGRAYEVVKGERTARAASVFHSMGLAYGASGAKEKGEQFIRTALAINRKLKDSVSMAGTLTDLAGALNERQDYAGAATVYREALAVAQAQGMKSNLDIIRQNMAYNEMKRGNFSGAAAQYKATLQSARASGDMRVARYVLGNLISLSDSLHDYASAYQYSQQLAQANDTIASASYQGGIADAEKKYETQRALRERDRLFYESSRALQQRNTAIGIGAGIVVALTLLFSLTMRIRSIRAKTKEEQRATRSLFEGEQAERIRIARDLHDSIGQMLAVVKMRLSSEPQDEADNKAIITNLVDKTIDEVRSISHNLIPEDLTFGTVRALENLCAQMAENSGIAVQLSVDDAVRTHRFNQEFGLSLYRIVQEVLGNMMKHSGASAINLEMARSGNIINLQIADNGKGFDASHIRQSSGIGWKNIYARVGLLNGSVDVRSERISGTRIQISIPQ